MHWYHRLSVGDRKPKITSALEQVRDLIMGRKRVMVCLGHNLILIQGHENGNEMAASAAVHAVILHTSLKLPLT